MEEWDDGTLFLGGGIGGKSLDYDIISGGQEGSVVIVVVTAAARRLSGGASGRIMISAG